MIRPLVKMLIKLASACPDELATLLYNVVGIMSAHYGELGMSWMLSIPADYMTSKQKSQLPEGEMPFVDVPDGAWYRDELSYAYNNGLIAGTSANMFSPDSLVTRGQVVTVLYRIAGEPSVKGKTCPFTDLEAGWCRDAIIWAYNAGIASGFSASSFGENENVTREQLAAFMYRYADKLVYFGNTATPEAFDAAFSDAGSVSPYAMSAMLWANGAGIIRGNTDGTLNPGGTATRAEFACMMARFHKLVGC